MVWFWTIFLLILGILLVFGIYDLIEKGRSHDKVNQSIDRAAYSYDTTKTAGDGHYSDTRTVSFKRKLIKRPYPRNTTYFIAIGSDSSILIGSDNWKKLLQPQEILRVELISDERTRTRKSVAGTAARAGLGYVVAGPLGAVVASQTGPSSTRVEPTNVALKLHLNLPDMSEFEIGFKEATSTGTTDGAAMQQEAKIWYNRLCAITGQS